MGVKRIAINTCFGGFGLSRKAYEQLIEWGVPVRKYVEQERDPDTHLYLAQPLNDGEVIFDRELTPEGEDGLNDLYWKYKGTRGSQRYWDSWTREHRDHPLVLRVIQELGKAADGPHAKLKIVEIPDDVEYTISEYDGVEHIAEVHQVWD